MSPPRSGARRLCAITAAFPSPAEPTRAIFVRNLLEALAAEGFESAVVAPRTHRRDPAREILGSLDVTRFSYPAAGLRLKERARVPAPVLGIYIASALASALAAIRRSAADVIYAHWVLPAGVVGALAARLTGLPLVLHAHGSDVHRYALSSRPAALAARWAVASARDVLCVSEDLARRVGADLGAPRERVHVVRMGVDERCFAPRAEPLVRAAPDAARGRLRLLFVGDLEEWKGILALAHAIAAAPRLESGVRLDVVGDGAQRGALEALACDHAAALRVHGRLPQEEVATRCRDADLLVLPSRGEGCPVVVLEALASGLPVLATPVGGIPEVVADGEHGWLAPAADFPARLVQLLDAPERLDEARRRLAALAAAPQGHPFGARRAAALAARRLRAAAGC